MKKFYWCCACNEATINACGFWSDVYPSRAKIADEIEYQCDFKPTLIMSITPMTEQEFLEWNDMKNRGVENK